jgi:SulP family sulfate permease
MVANLGQRVNLANWLQPTLFYLKRPYTVIRNYDRANLRPDLIAGITVAVIGIPTAIAFATLAGLPPEMGLYATIVGGIFGTLWSSSNQVQVGPTNTMSLIVLSTLSTILLPGSPEYIVAAGVLAVMVGFMQLVMGIFRLGILVNFVSHSLIIGFTFGAGLLIVIRQIAPLLGLPEIGGNVVRTVKETILHVPEIHPATAMLGILTIIIILGLQRINRRLPGPLIAMIITSLAVFLFNLDEKGVAVVGQLPRRLPPIAHLPLFNLDLIASLSTGVLAVVAIGLIQSIAIVRSIAAQTGQRLDSNQEFVSQGISNLVSGFLSGYPGSASFSSSVVNIEAGAKTPVAAVFSSLVVLVTMFFLASLTAYLPVAVLSGVLILAALGLTNRREIVRILRGAPGDALILLSTSIGVLFLSIEFAVLLGVLFSFTLYLFRTSMPRVHVVLPDDDFKHFSYQPGKSPCPQLGILDILGDLYFGAVNHVEEIIFAQADKHPEQRFLLIRMTHVNHCDFSGIHVLESVIRTYRDRGGDVFLVRVSRPVAQLMQSTGFDRLFGLDHFLDEDEAIHHLFHRILDPVICIYECPLRVFKECQNLPKQVDLVGIPHETEVPSDYIFSLTSQELWRLMHVGTPPYVIDVREPREFKRGHVPGAHSVPLSTIFLNTVRFPGDQQIVVVCRSSRRSRRAAYVLQHMGIMNVSILEGGMLAWEAAGLLEAIDTFVSD